MYLDDIINNSIIIINETEIFNIEKGSLKYKIQRLEFKKHDIQLKYSKQVYIRFFTTI